MGSGDAVFISSVIRDFDANRDAAAEGITGAGYVPRRSEDFGALDQAPHQACLQGVRDCEVTVLVLGPRYGDPQPSGLSVTHEEFREAMRLLKPVFVFIEEDAEIEEMQAAFVREVRDYLSGRVTAGFRTPTDLKVAVTRALLRWEQGLDTARADPEELDERARSYVRPTNVVGGPSLILVVAGGPMTQVIRPGDLSDQRLARDVMQMSMFGANAVLTAGDQTSTDVRVGALHLRQRDRSVTIEEHGTVRVALPAVSASVGLPTGRLAAVIHEDVEENLQAALSFAMAALDAIDTNQRLTDLAVLAAIDQAGYLPWRTRAEHDVSPNTATMNPQQPQTAIAAMPGGPKARVAVRIEVNTIAGDLTALLARQMR